MTKIYIDAGHGGNDPGSSGNGLKEKDVTLTIAKKVQALLKGYATVKMSRTTDKTLSLTQRTNDANNWGADYFLSIHINAGGGTGYEDYIYNGSVSNKTVSTRNTMHAEIIKQISDVRNRGKKTANFAVLRQTSMPAMLSENLFIDTKADADLLKSNAFLNKVAQGHANGIIKAFGLSKATDPDSEFIWVGTDKKGRRVESIYRGSEGLNYYDGPRWTKPSGTFGYGQGWKVDNLYRVDGSLMYRVQNSKGKLYWITASSKYVKVI